ncbi:MAG: Toxin-antitoxin system antitoxin [Pseudomonadota bacterium]|jgi:antitoxin CcdA
MGTVKKTSKKYVAASVATKTLKKATNVTLSTDVLKDARSLGINISQACDEFLRGLVGREKARKWKEDHADYINRCNQIAEEEGGALDQWRSF